MLGWHQKTPEREPRSFYARLLNRLPHAYYPLPHFMQTSAVTSPASTVDLPDISEVPAKHGNEMPSMKRWLYILLGVTSFILAIIGAIVPGMPTTVFVLIGGYFLIRSSPATAHKLLSLPLLRPYARFVTDPNATFSRKARSTAIMMMSLCVAASTAMLYFTDRLTMLTATILSILWLCGLISILMFRRRVLESQVKPVDQNQVN